MNVINYCQNKQFKRKVKLSGKMKRLFVLLFLLSALVASTVVFAKPTKRMCKSYKCKHVGKPKVKPYNFRPRHFGNIVKQSYKTSPKFRVNG